MTVMITSRIMARTTVDIDAEVLRELKRRQKREGKTLGRLVSELLATALREPEPDATPEFHWISMDMGVLVDLEDKEGLRRAMDSL